MKPPQALLLATVAFAVLISRQAGAAPLTLTGASGDLLVSGTSATAATGSAFADGDTLSYTGTPTAAFTVSVIGNIAPGAIALSNTTAALTWAGGSTITGTTYTKTGTGAVYFNTPATFSGGLSTGSGFTSTTTASTGNGLASQTGTLASLELYSLTADIYNLSGDITLTNTASGNMLALGGLGSGVNATKTLTNNITLSASAVASRIVILGDAATNTAQAGKHDVILSGKISGGAAGATFYVNTDQGTTGASALKLTNALNDFTATIQVNRGGLAVTSDAALGNAANNILLDVGVNSATGLRFDAAMTSNRNIALGGGRQIFNTQANAVTLGGVISGTGQIYKTGSGTLTLSNTNTYSGITTITAGTLALNSTASIGSAAITLAGTGNALLRTSNITGAAVLGNNITLTNPGAAGNLGIQTRSGAGNSLQLNGIISGGGSNTTLWLDTSTAGDSSGKFILNNTNTYAGKTYINRGSVQLNNAAGFGTSDVQFDSNPNAVLSFNSPMTVANKIAYTFGAKIVDTGANDVTLSGAQDIQQNLTKTGSGKLTLTAANTGSTTAITTISEGTLALSGSGTLPGGGVVVGSGATFDVASVTGGFTLGASQTISGGGSIIGDLTLAGSVRPGSSPGQLSFTGNPTLAGTVVLEITGTSLTQYDQLAGNGSNILSLGGDLTLDNTGYTAVLGDLITVFRNWSSITGSFASINGTALNDGLSWDTTNLNVNGTLVVVPEPSAGLLSLIGALALARRKRR